MNHWLVLLASMLLISSSRAFSPPALFPSRGAATVYGQQPFVTNEPFRCSNVRPTTTRLRSSSLSETEQNLLGVSGTVASLVVLYSEFTLKVTGCGLPAGPLGLYGAAEGVSYLLVIGLTGYSLVTKVKTGSGLPATAILRVAEGLAYVAALVGLVVLGFQIADFGYIPNAIPTQGGICS